MVSLHFQSLYLQLVSDTSIVGAATFSPADDPFAVSFEDYNRDTTINLHSAYVAAQQAVAGFAQLPASASRTFIYTGNVLNVTILPQFLESGIGKSGSAHMMWAASRSDSNQPLFLLS